MILGSVTCLHCKIRPMKYAKSQWTHLKNMCMVQEYPFPLNDTIPTKKTVPTNMTLIISFINCSHSIHAISVYASELWKHVKRKSYNKD
jgi:hypothetical protein